MPYYYWDPTYILVLIGALLSVGASALVNRTFNRYSSVYARSGLTGAQAAQKLLHSQGIYDVQIQHISGSLTDHYDPTKQNRLVFQMQYTMQQLQLLLVLQLMSVVMQCSMRKAMCRFLFEAHSFQLSILVLICHGRLIVIGLFINSSTGSLFLNAGLLLFSLVVLFQLVTLPVEINASRRAVRLLDQEHILIGDEVGQTARVLKAAAIDVCSQCSSIYFTAASSFDFNRRKTQR